MNSQPEYRSGLTTKDFSLLVLHGFGFLTGLLGWDELVTGNTSGNAGGIQIL
jgi:hypothetical protein